MTMRKRVCSVAILVALAVPACEQALLKPTSDPEPPDSPEAVVAVLQRAYEKRGLGLLGSILAADPARNAVFRFHLSEPTEQGETEWGHDEEVRIHRRMFRPEDYVTGATPVPNDLWLSSISVHLRQLEPFAEITDLYSADQGKDGKLDPDLWKVVGARYDAEALFDTAGDLDFYVDGVARFVIIEDLTKQHGDGRRFLLYQWDDEPLQAKPEADGISMSAARWSGIKELYR